MDMLRNSAGAISSGGLLNATDDRWRRTCDLTVFGLINLTREIDQRMRGRKNGVIVNMSGTIVGGTSLRPRARVPCHKLST